MIKSLITDPTHYSQYPIIFSQKLRKSILKHKPEFVTFRDKSSKNRKILLSEFIKTTKNLGIKNIFINGSLSEAKKYKANGVHLTSELFNMIKKAKTIGLKVSVSTHSLDEVLKCKRLGANYIYYSPIFYVKDKNSPKGVDNLKKVIDISKANIIALGGIVTNKDIKKIEDIKPYGFSSIRYFI